MEVPTPVAQLPAPTYPAECFLGAEPPEGFIVPVAPTGDALAILKWQVAVLMMRLNSVETANDVNSERLEVCKSAAPPEASGVVG